MGFIIIRLTFISFLSGAVMYSYLIPRYVKKIDPREQAYDKNPGGSNAINACGLSIGIICILLDIGKAFIPVYITIHYFNIIGNRLIPVAVAPVLGHAFSPFMRFKGGKAVASAYGALLALYPYSITALILALIMFFFKVIIVVKPDSAGSITSFITVNLILLAIGEQLYIRIIMLSISLVVICKQLLHPDIGEKSAALFNKFLKLTFGEPKNHA